MNPPNLSSRVINLTLLSANLFATTIKLSVEISDEKDREYLTLEIDIKI